MVNDRDLFGIRNDGEACHDRRDKIAVAACRLAIHFADEADLPVRYRKSSRPAKSRKIKDDEKLETRFKANVKAWTEVIETMLSKIDNQQAWRFIDLSPEIPPTVKKLTDSKDFCDFLEYLGMRRDKEKCSADELGGLTLLLMPFQRKIEERIGALPG
jgi:hypothetical protein